MNDYILVDITMSATSSSAIDISCNVNPVIVSDRTQKLIDYLEQLETEVEK